MVKFHVACREVNVVDFVIEAEDRFEARKLAYRMLDFDDVIDWRFSNYDVTVFEEPVTISSEE
jgi:hypothetical protein